MDARFDNTFGKRLKLLRMDKGLTQDELAQKMREDHGVAVGQNYISEMERFNKIPSGGIVAAMAKALGTTTDYLLMVSNAPTPPAHQEASYA